jgi:uncharacterized glyoxalase superfamily protein PhnB
MPATIYPVLHYGDLARAVVYLGEAFGFVEHRSHRTADGALAYVELTFDGCTIGMGTSSADGGPFDRKPTAVYVATEDPDALYQRAVTAGAEIVMELTDQDYGSREFAARDVEGNVWCFGTYRPGA